MSDMPPDLEGMDFADDLESDLQAMVEKDAEHKQKNFEQFKKKKDDGKCGGDFETTLRNNLEKEKEKCIELEADALTDAEKAEVQKKNKINLEKQRYCDRCKSWVPRNQELWLGHQNNHSSRILPYLYLGGERNAHNETELLHRTKVTHVLNMAWETKNAFPDDVEYLNFRISDHGWAEIEKTFDGALKFIDKVSRTKDAKVLVHCVQGISRSSTVVIAYLIKYKGYSFDEAYNFVKGKRSIIKPNDTFHQALVDLDKREQIVRKNKRKTHKKNVFKVMSAASSFFIYKIAKSFM